MCDRCNFRGVVSWCPLTSGVGLCPLSRIEMHALLGGCLSIIYWIGENSQLYKFGPNLMPKSYKAY